MVLNLKRKGRLSLVLWNDESDKGENLQNVAGNDVYGGLDPPILILKYILKYSNFV